MTVLHIVECAGGVERYLSMLLPLLEKDFYQIMICSQHFQKEKFESMIDEVKQVEMLRTLSPLPLIKVIKEIRHKVKGTKPDIVYCHSSFAGALGRIAVIGLPCKVVYNPHGWAFNMR